ncbi:MAG: response regulator, partial [Deltaproteobacteria bacterium]|nr:response regulator [Deltaproteobacteria bacterium]
MIHQVLLRQTAMKPKLLIIEDEPTILDTLRYALETEGYEVFFSHTAQEGKKILQDKKMDALILDVGLPDQNGFELCKEIRKTNNIPILFLTARSSEIDKVVGLEIGADDYLTKPFSPRELVARVKAILRRVGGIDSTQPSEKISLKYDGPFEVDEEKGRIRYHQELLDLTRYEFLILKLLIGRPGRIFSRDDLMEL